MWWEDANFEACVLYIRLCGKLIQEKKVDRSVYDNYHIMVRWPKMFLGTTYVTMRALCMVLTIFYFDKHKLSPRKLVNTR